MPVFVPITQPTRSFDPITQPTHRPVSRFTLREQLNLATGEYGRPLRKATTEGHYGRPLRKAFTYCRKCFGGGRANKKLGPLVALLGRDRYFAIGLIHSRRGNNRSATSSRLARTRGGSRAGLSGGFFLRRCTFLMGRFGIGHLRPGCT